MPPEILTVEQIRQRLNGNYAAGNWVEVQGLNIVPIVNVAGPGQLITGLGTGLVVKSFINTHTAELKFFLAKSMDIQERNNL